MGQTFRDDEASALGEAAPTEEWLFARLIRGEPIPPIINPEARARTKRDKLERLAQFSSRHAEKLSRIEIAEAEARRERESLEWAARISTRAEEQLRALQQEEAAEREAWRRAEAFYERYVAGVIEGNPDQPRVPEGSPQGGQWTKGGAGGTGPDSLGTGGRRSPAANDQVGSTRGGNTGAGRFQPAAYRPGSASVKLTAAAGGATAGSWPVFDPRNLAMPRIDGAAGAAGVAATIGAVGFATALRNASMGRYWERVPATQVMPQHWAYELEKRVRAGTLSRNDAIGSFSTAVLGAQAQGFKPTGNVMSAVHKSMMDFLSNAEAVYFAKKKKAVDAAADPRAGHGSQSPSASAPAERVTGQELEKRRREFDGMRSELWKEEARRNPEKYSHDQLQQMRQGKAPRDSDGNPFEIHHKKPLSEGGRNEWENFEFKTRQDHRIGPNFKKNHPNLPPGSDK